ncbi:hypothetical protein NECID01_0803 [Nematocida sp. AWRm77]|nr:hypothetical protein NECID01_0803 [Nematocida sp. AWRm77]
MERKVEKELDDAKEDIQDAIDAERKRGTSLEELKSQTVEIDDAMGEFRTESQHAKSRLWWKSAKWIAIASILVFLIAGGFLLFIISKVKQLVHKEES